MQDVKMKNKLIRILSYVRIKKIKPPFVEIEIGRSKSTQAESVLIDDVRFDKPSQPPYGLNASINVSITNVGSMPVNVKEFHFKLADDVSDVWMNWIEAKDKLDNGYFCMTHIIPMGRPYLGNIPERPIYNQAIKLMPGDVVQFLSLEIGFLWKHEGKDDGTRYQMIFSALDSQKFSIRSLQADGSYAYYPSK